MIELCEVLGLPRLDHASTHPRTVRVLSLRNRISLCFRVSAEVPTSSLLAILPEEEPMSIEPAIPDLDVLVDLKTVCSSLCRSRASIYRDIERGAFPRPIKLGHSSRWRLSDLRAVITGSADTSA